MKIAIYGLGYVGLTAAGCLTSQGHEVLGVDVNESKVAEVGRGETPITEPGLPELIATAAREGRLSATHDPGERLAECEIAFVCVGTPSMPDGSLNMSYIAEVSRQIARSVSHDRPEPLVVVYRSTLRPGTLETLIQPIFRNVLGDAIHRVQLVYNPEFLRESVAVKDFFSPPKIVIGTAGGERCGKLDELNRGIDAPVFYTRFREAEITKFIDNTFHALKVAFGNEIGRVCLQLGIDPELVHQIFVSDTKLNISPRYLRPGGAFGGSCLPKDLRALQHLSADVGANTHVIDAVMRSNDSHKQFLFNRCVAGLAPASRILMLGLAFKADSDDLRESPNMDLARKILQAGHQLAIFDPSLDPAKLVGQNLGYAYANLPQLSELLVDKAAAEASGYDRVIDTNGLGDDLKLDGVEILNVYALGSQATVRADKKGLGGGAR
jgi:GDP-mannose 6-dehydrogenase